MRTLLYATLVTSLCATAPAQNAHPRDSQIHDADTKAWWHTTEALSGDDMEGRDTGTAAYQRAADYVVTRFKAAGLQPAGENGGYFQNVPMHQVEVNPSTALVVISEGEKSGDTIRLKFLQDITVTVSESMPMETVGQLVFRGYCGKDQGAGLAGKIAVCFGTQRQGLPSGAERAANVRSAGGVGIINVDDPYFSIEPPRWPFAYARAVSLRAGQPSRPEGKPFLSLRISAEAFTRLLKGTGRDAGAILKTGGAKQPLESFDFPANFSSEPTLKQHRKTLARPTCWRSCLAPIQCSRTSTLSPLRTSTATVMERQ